MKKLLSLVVCYFAVTLSFAQQDKQYTHFMFDRMSFNPAATGFKGICGTLIYRNQWDRVQDAPNSTLFNAEMNLPKQNMGVGLSFLNDAIGFQRFNTVTLQGSYHIPTSYGILSAGLGLGILNMSYNPTWIPPEPGVTDPNLPSSVSGIGFDANLGLYWHGTQPYYVGISTTHLAPPKFKENGNVIFSTARHYYVIAGYEYNLSNATGWQKPVHLEPNILVKSDGSTTILDINLMGDVYLSNSAYLWAGVTYRMADGIPFMLGYAFAPQQNPSKNWMKIGYSFDVMTNPLKEYGKGTHELMLNYCFFPPPPVVPRHGNPFILQ